MARPAASPGTWRRIPPIPNITFGGNYSGVIDMQDRATGLRARLDPWPLNPMGHDAKDSKYRFQWTFPIMNSPHDPHTLYVGSNVVFKSTDNGKDWQIISPDLTRTIRRRSAHRAARSPRTRRRSSITGRCSRSRSRRSRAGLIWAGSDDGLIHVTRDGGKTWKNVTPKGLPQWTRISIIDPSPHNAGTAWVAANRYQLDDYAPYLYKTTDYGATWTRINDGHSGRRVHALDPRRSRQARACSTPRPSASMWLSRDAGAHWESLKRNLPPVPVHDIALRDDDMVIATHGRAFWVMENLALLRAGAGGRGGGAGDGKAFLYHPAPAYRAGGVTVQYRLAARQRAGDDRVPRSRREVDSQILIDRHGRHARGAAAAVAAAAASAPRRA